MLNEARMEQARQDQLQQYYLQMKQDAQRAPSQQHYDLRAEPPRTNVNYNPVYHNSQNSQNMGSYYQNQLQHNFNMKDYSKDPNVNGWAQTNALGHKIELGPVALQAQGYQLPQRQAPQIQPYPIQQ
jgi:hypothetical protein